jgi:hypothetical protein
MHEQTNDGLPETITLSKDIQRKQADEDDEDDAQYPGRPI